MKILVTNDDGINAKGLWAVAEELKEVGEVVVVAPDREQSGIGTAVSLHHPLRISQIEPLVRGIEAYSVEGTPADAVILALDVVTRRQIDLIVSGINGGANLGDDVLISGTVGAALMGYLQGFPALALSVATSEEFHFEVAARLAVVLAGKVAASLLPSKFLLNINVPNLPLDKIRGIEITRLARKSYVDLVEEKHDGRRKYYWIVRGAPQWNSGAGTDKQALDQDKISITPLHSNLTDMEIFSSLQTFCPLLFQKLNPVQGCPHSGRKLIDKCHSPRGSTPN